MEKQIEENYSAWKWKEILTDAKPSVMLPDQGGIPLNAWKLEKGRCLIEKKKIEIKKQNRNWGFKVLHCLEISGPPEKPNVCRYKYFHMFLINFIGLRRALDSDWEFLKCAIFYEL